MNKPIEVGLFITCLVDAFRPSVAFASLKLLEEAGCKVHVPVAQTCCGQTAWNSDDKEDAQAMAIDVIKSFAPYEYIVTPSQSCAQMLCDNYRALFSKDPTWKEQAEVFSSKVYELTDFLKTVLHTHENYAEADNIMVGKDMAVLLESASKLRKQGSTKQVRHVAEVMAGMLETPSIGGKS